MTTDGGLFVFDGLASAHEPSFLYLHVFTKLYFLSMFNDLANFNEYVVSYWFDGVTVNVAEPSEPLRSLIEFDTAFW